MKKTRRCSNSILRARSGPYTGGGGLGDEEMDMAVFRFTLGIPGFEDRQIPRVVGAVGALLVVVNHFLLAAQPAPPPQARAMQQRRYYFS
jgi:hypothetical protein